MSLRNDDDQEKAARVTLDPTLCEAAELELDRLPLDSGYSFTGVWSENNDIAGEAWLHGYHDEAGEECWRVRSVDEVDVSPDGRTVNLKDDFTGGPGRRVDLAVEELYRLWVPHPRRGFLADSALRAMLDTLEDIVLTGREIRAAALSRIAANGLLFMPVGLTVLKNVVEDADDEQDEEPFMADFTAAITAPIINPGDPGGVAPVVITGEKEDIEAVRFERLEREDSEQLVEKLNAFLSRMANGLDIPPEILTGMADVNHWTAWQIDSSTARHHIEPSVRNMADSLTTAFLRPALRTYGFPPAEIKRVRVWYDLGSLTENPNRRQDAIDARDRGDIGPAAFRAALGFNEEDAPTPAELLAMIAMKTGMDTAAATAIMQWYATQQEGEPLDLPALAAPAPKAIPQQRAEAESPAGPGQPAGSTPDSANVPPPAQTASARGGSTVSGTTSAIVHNGRESALIAAGELPPYRLAVDQARQLMEVDRALRTAITAAAEAALQAALAKAGSRLRAKATADQGLSLQLKPYAGAPLCRFVGREQAFALGGGADFLLAQAFDTLREKFTQLVTLGIGSIVDRVLKMLGLKRDSGPGRDAASRMERAMTERMDDGWNWLHNALQERAEKVMFDGPDDDTPGELSEGDVPAYFVRAALALVGGLPETSGGIDEHGRSLTGEPLGGLANGDTVRREVEDAGGTSVGYLWVYGVTPQQRRFEPHWDLEGERFTAWSDPKLETADKYAGRYTWVGPHFVPGDHTGCMCDYVPAWVIPQYAAQVRERLAIPTQNMRDILGLAEMDDKAGRTNTTAQVERGRYQAIQDLQNRFMEGNAA